MLPAGWYRLVIAPGVTPNLPGIYRWDIEGVGSYIGKYTRSSRPLREYEKNVLKIITGQPYRPQKPTSFRRIHTELALAVRHNIPITLTLLENALPENLSARERHCISVFACTLNGRRPPAI